MAQRYLATTFESLPPGTARSLTIGARKLALFNVGGRVYALDDICPHAGAPLADGALDGTTVICPWHGAEFDVTTGKVLCPPAVEDLQSYPVIVNGDSIEVEL